MAAAEKEWRTGVVFSERLATHFNAWNKDFTERPQRLLRSIERCKELGLLQRCKQVPLRKATEAEILTCHTKKHLELLKSTEEMNEEQLKSISQKYDYIYFHEKSYENAILTVGGLIDLVDEVATGKIRNGMAIIRPPGHHAMAEEFCGYCYFSNVAIAAQVALDKHKLNRILVFDWDVHHGQGSQFKFYNDPRVLFVSMHRYEHGEEWPYLRESDYDYIGEGPGKGYTINVPLNETGFGNDEYLSVFFNLILPVFYEFDPELVLVSAGYDCAVGCPEGEMAVTPACFAHFVNILTPLASGKLVLALEGGYNLKSLSESVALSLRALLGDPCPNIAPISAPRQSVVESVLNCIKVLHPYWRCLRYQDLLEGRDVCVDSYPFSGVLNFPPAHHVKFSTPESRPEVFPLIQECADVTAISRLETWNNYLDELIKNTSLRCAENRVSITSDKQVSSLRDYLIRTTLWSRCISLEEKLPSCAGSSVCVKACIDSILSYKVQSSVCLVHTYVGHSNGTANGKASAHERSIDLAVQYASSSDHINRILVVQLGASPCCHQVLRTNNSSTLYVTVAWQGNKNTNSGQSTGEIYSRENHNNDTSHHISINIKENAITNGDLMSVLFQIILPVSYEFCPDLVILTWRTPIAPAEISRASLTPACLGHVTQLLMGLAQGKLLLLIENESSQGKVMEGSCAGDGSQMVAECVLVMSGGAASRIDSILPSEGAVTAIKQVQDHLKNYWKIFQFRHSLPKVQI
ncbi:hypothetical protein BsWGS_12092 [Bradybaena similaris]